MVAGRIIKRLEYILNKEDIQSFKKMFNIKGTLEKLSITTKGEYTTEEEFMKVVCVEQ